MRLNLRNRGEGEAPVNRGALPTSDTPLMATPEQRLRALEIHIQDLEERLHEHVTAVHAR